MNNIFECRTCKKFSVGFCLSFILFLVLAAVMLGICDLTNAARTMLCAGIFIALSVVSLALYIHCVLLVYDFVENNTTYAVYLADLDKLVKDFGFCDECNRYERTFQYRRCLWILRIDATTGEISCSIVGNFDEFNFRSCMKFAIKDLIRDGMVYTAKQIV